MAVCRITPLTLICLVCVYAGLAFGQSTTTSNCNLNGNTATCTSNTVDYGAQNQRAYEQGRQIGSALGQGISGAMQAHSFGKGLRKYCIAHPGGEWKYTSYTTGQVLSSGHCPSEGERASTVAFAFMAKHKDFVQCAENSKVMVEYFETNSLNPFEEKSYEHAYKSLKKDGKLQLYAK